MTEASSRASAPPRPRSHGARVPALLALTLLASIPACGGGGGGGSGLTTNPASLAPLGRAPTRAEIQHFLRRTTFGAHPDEIARVAAIGLDAWLEQHLAIQVDTPVERAADAQIQDPREPRMDELARWWIYLMARNPNGLQEVLAFFWHDHFATSQTVMSDRAKPYFVQHVNLLRRMGTGNLRELAYQLAIDPSMLVWLDGVTSTRQAPNENFAREFWEVFTLGRNRGYTETDIKEAARAFTGWRRIQDSRTGDHFFVFDPQLHDAGTKTVFGRSGEYGYRELVDLTFRERQAAEYLVARIFAYFAYPDPEPRLIADMARFLREHDYELRPFLRMLLQSQAFFSERARAGRIKMPVEYVLGFVRTTRMEMPMAKLYEALIDLNQVPTAPPSVFGWPEGNAWLGATSVLQRGDVLNDVIASRDHHVAQGVNVSQLLPPADQRSAAQVVDALADLMQVQLTPDETVRLRTYLDSSVRESGGQLVVEPSRFDGTNTRHLDERVHGLLFILSQHPNYHLR